MIRTKLYRVMPWVGGINTSVDPGVLNSQELVQADNVQFSSAGARIKREALEYLDNTLEAPDYRSSSGTTRTLKWTSSILVATAEPEERLVVGERITVSGGNTHYDITSAQVATIAAFQEVTSVVCVADVSNSLRGKYFLLSAGDSGVDYYVWFKTGGVGTDPLIPFRTGIEVDVATGATNSAVATAVAAALPGAFGAPVSGHTITITATAAGFTKDATAGTSGFTVSVTTQGGHSITYTTPDDTYSEGETAAAGEAVARASQVIMSEDYWRYSNGQNIQLLIFGTNDFQLFSLDGSGRRNQIHGQEQTSQIVCTAASAITGGHYFLINAAANSTEYYVWYKKAGVGSDPLVGGRTGIEVDIGATDTNAQVATATKNALNAVSGFSATASTNTVTVATTTSGITDETEDGNTGFTITTTFYGATLPPTAVSTLRHLVFNESFELYFSGLGNFPVIYNPDDSAKYQLIAQNLTANDGSGIQMPDASFAWLYLGRVWANDKNNKDFVHYSETFDETKWLGFGDSGAFPVNPGDGDPEGIVNGYGYKTFQVISKKDGRHRIDGDSPENFQVTPISAGLGNEGALVIPVDEEDVVFLSKRGIHSQATTDRYGDTSATFLSADIKPTFNTFATERLKYTQGTYIPELNSIALAISEQGNDSQNAVWLYNATIQTPNKPKSGAWYRWPNVSCTSLSRRFVNEKHKIIMGTKDGRIVQAQKEGNFADFGTTGIPFTIKTGTIYPGGDPQVMKAFKRISMIYRPKGNFNFAVTAKIDNQQTQGFAFSAISGLDLLGDTFILGTSLLGSSSTLAPYTFTMNGYGRGVTITITQPTADQQVEIWGFVIEWEPIGLEQEVQ